MKYTMEELRKDLEILRDKLLPMNEHIEAESKLIEKLHSGLEVGDGVTIHLWSDAHACTIIKRTPKTLTVRRDKAIRTDRNGMSDCQSYRYEPDEDGTTYTVRWSPKYRRFRWEGKSISVGRHEYYDYTF